MPRKLLDRIIYLCFLACEVPASKLCIKASPLSPWYQNPCFSAPPWADVILTNGSQSINSFTLREPKKNQCFKRTKR
jgi:hypothetical protein